MKFLHWGKKIKTAGTHSTSTTESLSEAFRALDTWKDGVPFEAIRHVQNHKPSREITDKIIFSLNHAYDGTYYNHEEDYDYPTPLWYAIVAENHLSHDLIDPVIRLFTTTDDDWDFLNEQGQYLIGLLAKKYPSATISKVMDTIDRLVGLGAQLPYLFLFDAFAYAENPNKLKKWALKTLQAPGLYWREPFMNDVIVRFGFTEAIPILRTLVVENDWDRVDLEVCIEELESGAGEFGAKYGGSEYGKPYCEERDDWEKHYRDRENLFREEDENTPAVSKEKEPGRNEPCRCGSGKKWKRCGLVDSDEHQKS